jgi:hypothetical protein
VHYGVLGERGSIGQLLGDLRLLNNSAGLPQHSTGVVFHQPQAQHGVRLCVEAWQQKDGANNRR